jgi:TonB-dependent receptor
MAALLAATPAMAQVTDEDESDPASGEVAAEESEGAIVVTGIRAALQTASARKRNADTVMDSITATDIGAFPDKSVAEALQRVPGITVNRFALTTDTAHFTAEPSGVIIRGLPQVRNEFNGRDTFSANSSRGLSWGDVSTELMGGVDVYKNQTADLIEGGIAGSVNLRTRVPFDARGELIQVGVKVNYGDAAKEFSPDVNAYYSNRWDTGIGEIGLMGHAAYSHVKTASLGLQAYRGGVFTGGMLAGSEDVDGLFGPGGVVAPSGGGFLDAKYDRKRIGVASAAQWRSNDQRWLATLQYIRSNYTNEMREHGVSYGLFGIPSSDANFRFEPGDSGIPVPAPGTGDFTFGEDGFIDGGVFTENGGWWGDQNDRGMARNADGDAMIHSCYGWGGQPASYCQGYDVHGADTGTASRYAQTKSMTQDLSFNLKYEATDNLRLNFDAQFVDSTVELYDASMGFGSFSNIEMADLGTRPRVVAFHAPTNIDQSEGGLANPNNYYIANLADNVNDSEGQELALRADAEWDLPSGGFDVLRFGVRFSDRDQEVRNSAYNWANIANTWTNGCQYLYFNLDSQPGTCDPDNNPATNNSTTFNGYPAGFYEVNEFGNGFFGGQLGSFPFVPFSVLEDHGLDLFSRERLGNVRPDGSGGVGSFIPICERNGNPGTSYPVELPDSCFAENELTNVSEETRAAYIMAKFGDRDEFDLGGIRVSGNVGLRYVETRVKSSGFQVYPRITANPVTECPATPLVPGGLTGTKASPNVPQQGGAPVAPYHAICYLSPEDVQFASGGNTGTPVSSNVTHRHFLPSVNLRLDLSDSWLIRAAASRAMSRPDIGLLRNYMSISQELPGDNPQDDKWIRNAQGQIIGVTPEYNANATNPTLKPTTAWQFDLSLEHYFNNAGMFSFAVFHKSFQNYIQNGRFIVPVTNNGVTRNVEGSGPANGPGAKIQGFEVAYNRFFDFLPEPFNGFGMQTNYTYVRNKGIPNAALQTQFPTANPGINLALDPGSLEGLSKHSFNLVGMYEKGPVGARVAYNWRSRYLVTVSDCCVGLPVWQKAAGYLDASFRYDVTPNLQVTLEGSNLLNTQTVTMQQLADENSPEGRRILMQNSWFRQDRRFTIGVRWKMGS